MNYPPFPGLAWRQSKKGLLSDGTRPPPGLKKPSIFGEICEDGINDYQSPYASVCACLKAENPYRLPYSASERKGKGEYRLLRTLLKPYFPFPFVVSSIRPILSITALMRRLSPVSKELQRRLLLQFRCAALYQQSSGISIHPQCIVARSVWLTSFRILLSVIGSCLAYDCAPAAPA